MRKIHNIAIVALFFLILAFGHSGAVEPTPTTTPLVPSIATSQSPSINDPAMFGSYLLRNQKWVEGLRSNQVDLENVDGVFWHIFSQLPEEVIVYPTENYYYFILYVNHQQVWGNIRLPAWQRDDGILSFAYFEFVDFPGETYSSFTKHKMYGPNDGVVIKKVNRFTYEVAYRDKAVIFHLNQIPQEPPKLFPLHSDEQFVQRVFDESGFQFFLLFNTTRNYFFWALNEEAPVPDRLEPIAHDLLLGKISGFAFWLDKAHGGRKILASISRSHASRNDYFDGPFDQSADNYALETNFKKYIELAYPYTKGNIDDYGNLVKLESQRVGITAYSIHQTRADLLTFIERLRKADDPYQLIFNSRNELLKKSPPAAKVPATPLKTPLPSAGVLAPEAVPHTGSIPSPSQHTPPAESPSVSKPDTSK
jgi:hypothetical protein